MTVLWFRVNHVSAGGQTRGYCCQICFFPESGVSSFFYELEVFCWMSLLSPNTFYWNHFSSILCRNQYQSDNLRLLYCTDFQKKADSLDLNCTSQFTPKVLIFSVMIVGALGNTIKLLKRKQNYFLPCICSILYNRMQFTLGHSG